jgi:hypothetical protein
MLSRVKALAQMLQLPKVVVFVDMEEIMMLMLIYQLK